MQQYPGEYISPGTMSHNIVSYLQGENVGHKPSSNIWPMVVMAELVKRCGGNEFLVILKQARANKPGALERVKKILDGTFGDNTYSFFSTLDENNPDKMKKALRKIAPSLTSLKDYVLSCYRSDPAEAEDKGKHQLTLLNS